MKKLILVFSGPSGAGKSTMINYLLKEFDCAGLTVSHTTRMPRDGETDGISYHFVTKENFLKMVQKDEFVEFVECFGNYYGTSKMAIYDVLKHKDICILDLEYEGAYAIINNDKFKEQCVGILVLPPSYNSLKQRLMERNSETSESLDKRLNDSFKVKKIAKYQFVLINKELEISKRKIKDIVNNLKMAKV
ncbi:MAG: guanylate kinase [Alphaproteobacteria bacterium]|nr:guanylate kinase [Alphaproteobacteria bacterium]MBQ3944590.1 guanylate kinase [Alphaproteobacteria bacterium]